MVNLDPRLSGKLGLQAQKLAQRELQRLLPQAVAEAIQRETPRLHQQWQSEAYRQNLEGRRQRALQQGDAVEALEILKEQTQAEQAFLQSQQQQVAVKSITSSEAEAAWGDVCAFFESDEVPEEVRKPLYGKTYGELTNNDFRKAAQLFWKDITDGMSAYRGKQIEKDVEKRLRDELMPALKKEALGEVNGREPSPDTGSGGAVASEMVSQDEYERHKSNSAEDRAWRRLNLPRLKRAMVAGRLRA